MVEVTKNGPIQGKEYVPELKQYRYWVDIELEEGSVLEGSDVEIQASKYGKVYDMVVPRSCVIESRGQASVFVVKQREGCWASKTMWNSGRLRFWKRMTSTAP